MAPPGVMPAWAGRLDPAPATINALHGVRGHARRGKGSIDHDSRVAVRRRGEARQSKSAVADFDIRLAEVATADFRCAVAKRKASGGKLRYAHLRDFPDPKSAGQFELAIKGGHSQFVV